MGSILVYGATGYTGRLIAAQALDLGLSVVLGGRNASVLSTLATSFTRVPPFRSFDLLNAGLVDEALSGIVVLFNCAGPFHVTAPVLMAAALRTGAHYLDISAELDTYVLAQSLDSEAKGAGVMLLPGCGSSVTMLGCLALHTVCRAKRRSRKIQIALHVSGAMSKGSARSALEGVTKECLQLIGGKLVRGSHVQTKEFNFGDGAKECFSVTLPDLLTICHDTHVLNIETFVYISGDAFPPGDPADLTDGPTLAHREANRYQAAVEVLDDYGGVTHAVLDTINGYTFTALAAAKAMQRVVNGEVRLGFQTPAASFGSDFVKTIANSCIIDA